MKDQLADNDIAQIHQKGLIKEQQNVWMLIVPLLLLWHKFLAEIIHC